VYQTQKNNAGAGVGHANNNFRRKCRERPRTSLEQSEANTMNDHEQFASNSRARNVTTKIATRIGPAHPTHPEIPTRFWLTPTHPQGFPYRSPATQKTARITQKIANTRHLSIAPSRATSQRLLANQGYSLALRPISNSPPSAQNLRSWPLDSTLSIAPSRATSQRLLANQGYSLALRPISNSPLSARNLRSWPLDSTQPRHHATAVGESMRTHLAAPNI
jgi:hypothetical protein